MGVRQQAGDFSANNHLVKRRLVFGATIPALRGEL
jgi:hypothetical protein